MEIYIKFLNKNPTSVQVVQWITFLSQRAFLFALGAFSALGAKKDA